MKSIKTLTAIFTLTLTFIAKTIKVFILKKNKAIWK